MSIENIYKPILTVSTQRYRRNVFWLASIAGLSWWLGDAVDYRTMPGITLDETRLIKVDVALIGLSFLLGSLLSQWFLYWQFAEREIREWQRSVEYDNRPPVGIPGADNSQDGCLPYYSMYISGKDVPLVGLGSRFQSGHLKRSKEPDDLGQYQWTWHLVMKEGEKKNVQGPTSRPTINRAVFDRNWLDVWLMGRMVPYGATIIGATLLLILMAHTKSGEEFWKKIVEWNAV